MIDEELINRGLHNILGENRPPKKCTDDSNWDEAKFIKGTFEGKGWWEVSIEDWTPDIVLDSLYFFYPDCLRYYFPVFLKWIIFNYDYADAVRDCILDGIHSSNGLIEFELGEPAETIQFNKDESSAIRYLLALLMERRKRGRWE